MSHVSLVLYWKQQLWSWDLPLLAKFSVSLPEVWDEKLHLLGMLLVDLRQLLREVRYCNKETNPRKTYLVNTSRPLRASKLPRKLNHSPPVRFIEVILQPCRIQRIEEEGYMSFCFNTFKYHVLCTDGKISVRINLFYIAFFTVVLFNNCDFFPLGLSTIIWKLK